MNGHSTPPGNIISSLPSSGAADTTATTINDDDADNDDDDNQNRNDHLPNNQDDTKEPMRRPQRKQSEEEEEEDLSMKLLSSLDDENEKKPAPNVTTQDDEDDYDHDDDKEQDSLPYLGVLLLSPVKILSNPGSVVHPNDHDDNGAGRFHFTIHTLEHNHDEDDWNESIPHLGELCLATTTTTTTTHGCGGGDDDITEMEKVTDMVVPTGKEPPPQQQQQQPTNNSAAATDDDATDDDNEYYHMPTDEFGMAVYAKTMMMMMFLVSTSSDDAVQPQPGTSTITPLPPTTTMIMSQDPVKAQCQVEHAVVVEHGIASKAKQQEMSTTTINVQTPHNIIVTFNSETDAVPTNHRHSTNNTTRKRTTNVMVDELAVGLALTNHAAKVDDSIHYHLPNPTRILQQPQSLDQSIVTMTMPSSSQPVSTTSLAMERYMDERFVPLALQSSSSSFAPSVSHYQLSVNDTSNSTTTLMTGGTDTPALATAATTASDDVTAIAATTVTHHSTARELPTEPPQVGLAVMVAAAARSSPDGHDNNVVETSSKVVSLEELAVQLTLTTGDTTVVDSIHDFNSLQNIKDNNFHRMDHNVEDEDARKKSLNVVPSSHTLQVSVMGDEFYVDERQMQLALHSPAAHSSQAFNTAKVTTETVSTTTIPSSTRGVDTATAIVDQMPVTINAAIATREQVGSQRLAADESKRMNLDVLVKHVCLDELGTRLSLTNAVGDSVDDSYHYNAKVSVNQVSLAAMESLSTRATAPVSAPSSLLTSVQLGHGWSMDERLLQLAIQSPSSLEPANVAPSPELVKIATRSEETSSVVQNVRSHEQTVVYTKEFVTQKEKVNAHGSLVPAQPLPSSDHGVSILTTAKAEETNFETETIALSGETFVDELGVHFALTGRTLFTSGPESSHFLQSRKLRNPKAPEVSKQNTLVKTVVAFTSEHDPIVTDELSTNLGLLFSATVAVKDEGFGMSRSADAANRNSEAYENVAVTTCTDQVLHLETQEATSNESTNIDDMPLVPALQIENETNFTAAESVSKTPTSENGNASEFVEIGRGVDLIATTASEAQRDAELGLSISAADAANEVEIEFSGSNGVSNVETFEKDTASSEAFHSEAQERELTSDGLDTLTTDAKELPSFAPATTFKVSESHKTEEPIDLHSPIPIEVSENLPTKKSGDNPVAVTLSETRDVTVLEFFGPIDAVEQLQAEYPSVTTDKNGDTDFSESQQHGLLNSNGAGNVTEIQLNEPSSNDVEPEPKSGNADDFEAPIVFDDCENVPMTLSRDNLIEATLDGKVDATTATNPVARLETKYPGSSDPSHEPFEKHPVAEEVDQMKSEERCLPTPYGAIDVENAQILENDVQMLDNETSSKGAKIAIVTQSIEAITAEERIPFSIGESEADLVATAADGNDESTSEIKSATTLETKSPSTQDPSIEPVEQRTFSEVDDIKSEERGLPIADGLVDAQLLEKKDTPPADGAVFVEGNQLREEDVPLSHGAVHVKSAQLRAEHDVPLSDIETVSKLTESLTATPQPIKPADAEASISVDVSESLPTNVSADMVAPAMNVESVDPIQDSVQLLETESSSSTDIFQSVTIEKLDGPSYADKVRQGLPPSNGSTNTRRMVHPRAVRNFPKITLSFEVTPKVQKRRDVTAKAPLAIVGSASNDDNKLSEKENDVPNATEANATVDVVETNPKEANIDLPTAQATKKRKKKKRTVKTAGTVSETKASVAEEKNNPIVTSAVMTRDVALAPLPVKRRAHNRVKLPSVKSRRNDAASTLVDELELQLTFSDSSSRRKFKAVAFLSVVLGFVLSVLANVACMSIKFVPIDSEQSVLRMGLFTYYNDFDGKCATYPSSIQMNAIWKTTRVLAAVSAVLGMATTVLWTLKFFRGVQYDERFWSWSGMTCLICFCLQGSTFLFAISSVCNTRPAVATLSDTSGEDYPVPCQWDVGSMVNGGSTLFWWTAGVTSLLLIPPRHHVKPF